MPPTAAASPHPSAGDLAEVRESVSHRDSVGVENYYCYLCTTVLYWVVESTELFVATERNAKLRYEG